MERVRQRLAEVYPLFARELESVLDKEREHALVRKIEWLQIYTRCECDEPDCQSFYTAPTPEEGFGDGHRNVCLDAPYHLVLDVAGGDVMYVEVLRKRPLK